MAIINHGEIVANTSIRELLRDLNKESFLLDCQVPLPGTITVEGFHVAKVDEHTIEVHIEKGQDLVQAFEGLKQQGIKVLSMRNQANRLEQMFVSVLEQASMNAYEQYIAFTTLVSKEIRRYLRIWTQTLLPSAITMSLYYVILAI